MEFEIFRMLVDIEVFGNEMVGVMLVSISLKVDFCNCRLL